MLHSKPPGGGGATGVVGPVTSVGPSQFILACKKGDEAEVSRLLAAGVPVDTRKVTSDKSPTALMIAASKGHTSVVTRLLANKPDLAATTKGTLYTALHFAARRGSFPHAKESRNASDSGIFIFDRPRGYHR